MTRMRKHGTMTSASGIEESFENEDNSDISDSVDICTRGKRTMILEERGSMTREEAITKNDLGVDCISRTSALDSINWAYNLSDAYQKINDLPSVTPQPRKGHWIDEGIYADGQSYHAFMCSACEWHFIENKSELEDYKYCPFCGADMREVKNDKRRDTNTDHSTT